MLRIQSSRDFLQIVFRYRRASTLSVIVVAAVMIAGMLVKSPSFTSDAKLFIQFGKENQALPASVKAPGALIPATPSRDQLLDEHKILLGDKVVTSVAEHFLKKLSVQVEPEGAWEKLKLQFKEVVSEFIVVTKEVLATIGLRDRRDAIDSLKQDLLKSFEIGHDPGSAVIDVAFTWDDPNVAHDVLELWIKTFLIERDKLQGYNTHLVFYVDQVDAFKQKIKESQFELQSYLIDADSSNIKLKMETISQILVDVRDRQYLSKNELSALLSGISATDSQMETLSHRHLSEELMILNPIKMDLSERLNALIVERQSLLSEFKPGSKKIRSLDQSITALRGMIENEPDKIIGEQLTDNNPNYTSLESGMHQRTIRVEELKAAIISYDQQLMDLSKQLKGLVEQSVYVGLLETDIKKYQEEYENYKSGLEKAKLERNLEKNKISNVKVMQNPSYNPVRTSMKPLSAIVIFPVLAMVSALLVCYLLALLDRRIFDRSSIGIKKNIRIVDVIPSKISDDNEHYRASIFRLVSVVNHLVGKEQVTVAVSNINGGSNTSMLIDMELAKKAMGGDYRLMDGKSLINSFESYPSISDANYVLVAVESGKSTLPQLEDKLNTLQMTFPDKVLGVVLFNREYEIPSKIFSWISH